MRKDDMIRFRHMLDAATEARLFISGQTREVLDQDRKLVLALVKTIEIIGEAATRITEIGRQECASIPWVNIVGMRNRLIHAYFDIDLDILWNTITNDLPTLVSELKKVCQIDR